MHSLYRIHLLWGFFFGIFITTPAFSEETYTSIYSKEAREVYLNIIQLKLGKAKTLLAQSGSKISPLAEAHLASYIDFFTLFINEDQTIYNKLKNKRTSYLSTAKSSNSNSPYAAFVEAEILLQWALIDLKFDEKFNAYNAIYDAYNILESNKKKYPEFIENYKSLSIIHVLAESIPSWARKLLGIKGSVKLGTKEIGKLKLHALQTKEYMFRQEVAAINSYILFYQSNKQTEAIADLQKFELDHKKSPLIAFLKASMYQRASQNDKCLLILTETPRGGDYANFYYLDFMIGRCKLYKLDKDADVYFNRYISLFKGQHFIKESYQKLAWHALVINQDRSGYLKYINMCKSKGSALLDEDKQALNEAEKGTIPDPILLKSRLLCDGGYFLQAYQYLVTNQEKIAKNKVFQIETQYRMGRILQDLTRSAESILYYMKTIEIGREDPSYYACSAALQLGRIYEANNNVILARKYYNECLIIQPIEYANSLHQKAKSGLDRLNK